MKWPELVTANPSTNVPNMAGENDSTETIIEIINNTRGGIIISFTEKKRNAFFGGQIQVPDAGPGTDWLS